MFARVITFIQFCSHLDSLLIKCLRASPVKPMDYKIRFRLLLLCWDGRCNSAQGINGRDLQDHFQQRYLCIMEEEEEGREMTAKSTPIQFRPTYQPQPLITCLGCLHLQLVGSRKERSRMIQYYQWLLLFKIQSVANELSWLQWY